MSNNIAKQFCHRTFRKNPKQSEKDLIKNVTHLYMNGRKLSDISALPCSRLRVLYLHNNYLKKITNLDALIHLTHLYLQWNRITKIENLNKLKHLKKLYLGSNRIHCLENVQHLTELEEMHVERQQLGINSFEFDFRSLGGAATSLRVLNVSGLRLIDLNFVKHLPNLIELIAIDNRFETVDHITHSIKSLQFLREAQFSGCPAQLNDIYYRSKIVLASNSLVILDAKCIEEIPRKFLKNFEIAKKQRTKSKMNERNNVVDTDFRDEKIRFDGCSIDLTNVIAAAVFETIQFDTGSGMP